MRTAAFIAGLASGAYAFCYGLHIRRAGEGTLPAAGAMLCGAGQAVFSLFWYI